MAFRLIDPDELVARFAALLAKVYKPADCSALNAK